MMLATLVLPARGGYACIFVFALAGNFGQRLDCSGAVLAS
jgi:hypothetical protein